MMSWVVVYSSARGVSERGVEGLGPFSTVPLLMGLLLERRGASSSGGGVIGSSLLEEDGDMMKELFLGGCCCYDVVLEINKEKDVRTGGGRLLGYS